MADSPLQCDWNLVEWALSGTYDEDRPVLIDAADPQRFLTKRKARDLIASLAGNFLPDSTVCVHVTNDILYPVLVFAILASGARWTGTNPAYTSTELTYHLDKSEATYVITGPEYLSTVESAVSACNGKVEIVLFTDIAAHDLSKIGTRNENGQHLRTLHDLMKDDGFSLSARLQNISCELIATMMSTSGTTGLPKMVARTHRALVLETDAIEDANSEKPYDVRRLYCTPMFHAFSFPEMVVNTLRLGYPSYYMKRFDDTFAEKIMRFNITEVMAAPPMLLRLADQAKTDAERLNMQSLRMILCAGAPLTTALRSKFLAVFERPVRVVQVWGMSEGGWFATFRYPEDDETGSVGRAISGYRVRSSKDHLVRLADGREAAELLVRAPQLTTSYFGDDNATTQSFDAEGWLRTGDIGYVDDGKVYLVDRAKDMIKVNGWTVSPAELEAVLAQYPDVLDAAALGTGEGVDEHPVIFVVAKHANVTSSDVKAHLHSRLSRFKVAKCEIIFVSSLPRNPSGKVLRNVLRKQLEEGASPCPNCNPNQPCKVCHDSVAVHQQSQYSNSLSSKRILDRASPIFGIRVNAHGRVIGAILTSLLLFCLFVVL